MTQQPGDVTSGEAAAAVESSDRHDDLDIRLEASADELLDSYGRSRNAQALEQVIQNQIRVLELRPSGYPRREWALGNLGRSLLRYCTEQRFDAIRIQQCTLVLREGLEICTRNDSLRLLLLNNLADARRVSFEQQGGLDALTEAIALYREALILCLPGHPLRSSLLLNLASTLLVGFYQQGASESLAEAIVLSREVVNLCQCPRDHPLREVSLSNLANTLLAAFQSQGGSETLEEAIELYREALALRPSGHTLRSKSLNNLSVALLLRFEQQGGSEVLAEVIRLNREGLDLSPPGHGFRLTLLSNLSNALKISYKQNGNSELLSEAIMLNREGLRLCPHGHPEQLNLLTNLGCALLIAFEYLGGIALVEESIGLFRAALGLWPPGHALRTKLLHNLANALLISFEEQGCSDVLAEAIALSQEALSKCPPDRPGRSALLSKLADMLLISFQQHGGSELLAEAIVLYREVLELSPRGHPLRHEALSKLADSLDVSFAHHGGLEKLTEVIALNREALDICPPNHPVYTCLLNSLANALLTHGDQRGVMEGISEAVAHHHAALALRPSGHPQRGASLNNLGMALVVKFERVGGTGLLGDAIALYRAALDLRPPGHTRRASSLNNLALALMSSLEYEGGEEVLSEAITLSREALDLCPKGHHLRDKYLCNLANALTASFEQEHDSMLLAEAIELHQEALGLRLVGHPARAQSMRFLGTILCRHQLNMEEGLSLFYQGLECCPDGHPMLAELLFRISNVCLLPGTTVFNFDAAIACIVRCLQYTAWPARLRLRKGILVLRQIEQAYSMVSTMEDTANSDTREARNEAVLGVYLLAVRLLPRVASFHRGHASRLQELVGADELCRNGAARATLMGKVPDAVEMLEEGRGVFWSQALHLRTTELDVILPHEQLELQSIFGELEAGEQRPDAPDLTAAALEGLLEHKRKISERAECLVDSIRSRPGLERFLMPPSFTSLMQSLPKGFVVILITSGMRHHALVLDTTVGVAETVELQKTRGSFESKRMMESLPRDASAATWTSAQVETDCARLDGENQSDSEAKRAIRTSGRHIWSFEDILADLWLCIVRPILRVLGLKVSRVAQCSIDWLCLSPTPQQAVGRDRPRVWWCPTGELTFLPIHAAGIHASGSGNACATDYIVSSYVPSISALVRARKTCVSWRTTEVRGLLVAEAKPGAGWDDIANVEAEVRRVQERFNAARATIVNDTQSRATVEGVLTSLRAKHVNILHLACHGAQKTEPLQSAFMLGDGELTIRDLMTLNLKDASLAYLSACQTAKGNESQPDQAVHLAASMLFCGFKSVIGTMW
jgi:tetratricopeptide (TPR) repeat protein